MSQRNFKKFYLDNILDLLWRQWSALGALGGMPAEDTWIIDPEALLVFSLEMARYEPRLFEEILGWLVVNNKWIDIQRLRGIIKTKDEKTKRLTSAVSYFLSHEAKSYRRKWQALALLNRPIPALEKETLFKTKEGVSYPEPKPRSDIFDDYGFIRGQVSLRNTAGSVLATGKSNSRFLLRSLFGIGSRSECLLYLLTHEAGHPASVARAIGISVRGTQDALIELSGSGLVMTRASGKRKIEYWLDKKRWWEFISGAAFDEKSIPLWLDWVALFSALMSVWHALLDTEKADSDYMRSSKLREVMESAGVGFAKSGLNLPPIPGRHVRPERYEEDFQHFITEVLGKLHRPQKSPAPLK